MRSRPSFFDRLVAEGDHVAELPGRVDMHQREGRLRRIEGLHGEMQHDGRILADRIEHHRLLAFGGDFADDVDRLSASSRSRWVRRSGPGTALARCRRVGLRRRGPSSSRVPAQWCGSRASAPCAGRRQRRGRPGPACRKRSDRYRRRLRKVSMSVRKDCAMVSMIGTYLSIRELSSAKILLAAILDVLRGQSLFWYICYLLPIEAERLKA